MSAIRSGIVAGCALRTSAVFPPSFTWNSEACRSATALPFLSVADTHTVRVRGWTMRSPTPAPSEASLSRGVEATAEADPASAHVTTKPTIDSVNPCVMEASLLWYVTADFGRRIYLRARDRIH